MITVNKINEGIIGKLARRETKEYHVDNVFLKLMISARFA